MMHHFRQCCCKWLRGHAQQQSVKMKVQRKFLRLSALRFVHTACVHKCWKKPFVDSSSWMQTKIENNTKQHETTTHCILQQTRIHERHSTLKGAKNLNHDQWSWVADEIFKSNFQPTTWKNVSHCPKRVFSKVDEKKALRRLVLDGL